MIEVRSLFNEKNDEYAGGNVVPGTHNFRAALPVIHGRLTPLQYALTLTSKHDTAIWTAIMNNADLKEAYLLDGVVYRLIALAMMRGAI